MFEGENILVTGVRGGIGSAIASKLIAVGAEVIGTDLADDEPEVSNSQIRCYKTNLADTESVEELFPKLDRGSIEIHGPVNNAGLNVRGGILDISSEDWDAVMAVNLRGPFLMCEHAASCTTAQGAAILDVSPAATKVGGRTAGQHYSVAKAGINALTILLAREVTTCSIRVNAVCPGPVESPFHKDTTEEEKQTASRSILLGRFGSPEEAASAVAFLLSPEASYVTGGILDANGGQVVELI